MLLGASVACRVCRAGGEQAARRAGIIRCADGCTLRRPRTARGRTSRGSPHAHGQEAELRARTARNLAFDGSSGCFEPDRVHAKRDRAADGAECERVFLGLLTTFNRQGREVSPNAGRSYAPAVFPPIPRRGASAGRCSPTRWKRFSKNDRIHVEKFGPPSKLRQPSHHRPDGGRNMTPRAAAPVLPTPFQPFQRPSNAIPTAFQRSFQRPSNGLPTPFQRGVLPTPHTPRGVPTPPRGRGRTAGEGPTGPVGTIYPASRARRGRRSGGESRRRNFAAARLTGSDSGRTTPRG